MKRLLAAILASLALPLQAQVFPAKAIQQRTVKDLAQSHADEVAGDSPGDRGAGDAEILAELLERRQIHINRERTDDAERTEQADDEPGRAMRGQGGFQGVGGGGSPSAF